MYSIYLSTSDLLSFVISNTNKHKFSIWKWIRCCNDIMNDVDCVIKRDIYPQNVHSCSKNTCGISVFVLKITIVYKKNIYIMGDIAWIFAQLKDKECSYTPSCGPLDHKYRTSLSKIVQ